ncbi:MAG: GNAT family N-acetyltransferase [Candidatus Eremiobacteraeota bacterium]|nr:GNAT family N-acetyltransferase [Candidatus Eremiobacteraeota bacterium]
MGAFAIRPGTSADHAFVADLGDRTVGDSVAAFRTHPGSQPELSYSRLLEFVFDRSHVLLIAHDKAEPLGFVLMLDTMTDEVTLVPQGFVAYMAVEPSRRRSGIARALLMAVEDEARGRGLPYMALMVTESNASARALYERAGYATERRLLCKTL